MALKAFELRDGTNVMSNYAARTNKAIATGELRVEMNGWRSQMLLHTANPELFDVEDLLPYATDRGYSKDALQVQAMVRTIRASIPFTAEYSFSGGSWAARLSRADATTLTLPDLTAVATEFRALRTTVSSLDLLFRNTWGGGSWMKMGIGSYESNVEPAILRRFLAQSGFPVIRGDSIERLCNLRNWVENRLAGAGVPMVLFGFEGFINCANDTTTEPAANAGYDNYARSGATTLIGPMDIRGSRPVWRGPPMLGGNLVVVDCFTTYASSLTPTGKLALRPGPKRVVELPDDLHAQFGQMLTGKVLGLNLVVEGDLAYVRTLGSVTAYPFPPIATALALPNAGFTSVTVDAVNRLDIRVDSKWKVALPFGFRDVLAGGVTSTVQGVDYPVLSLRPASLGLTSTMEPLRDYVTIQKTNQKLSPKERASFEEAAKKMEPYLDAVIRMTVSTVDHDFPTLSMVEGLQLVRDGKKGDVDVLSEDIGKGMTLRKAAIECGRRRTKGEKVFAIARIHDEAVSREDLVSPNVLSRVDFSLWSLRGVKSGESWVITGSYDGEAAMPLSEMELAYLRAYDSPWAADSVMTDATIAVEFGFGNDFKTELQTLAADTLSETKLTQSWVKPGVDKYALAHADFIGAEGYPILNYPDIDAVTRVILIYKGLGDDPTNLLLSMFFANQLDLELI